MVLTCRDLSVAYGHHEALRDFGMSVAKGEIRALIGPNGSGKSTALQTVAGLIQPARGTVNLGDDPLHTLTRRALAKRLAFLPQQPFAPDEMTVEQLVRQGRFCHVGLFRGYGAHDEEVIGWAIESTGLGHLAHRGIRELSGGERQRAWMAASLAQEAAILVLDEPTSFLDIGYQIEVLELVHRLSRERAVTVVMAIHDINQAMTIADRISVLQSGRLVFDGDPHELGETDLIQDVFRVKGRFVDLAENRPRHFDIELARSTGQTHREGTASERR